MKNLILFLAMITIVGCIPATVDYTPLNIDYLPNYLHIDSIGIQLPATPDTLVSKDAIDFKPFRLDSGIVISERTAVRSAFFKALSKRMKIQYEWSEKLRKEYYDKSVQAQKLYQDEIARVRKVAERTWIEKNMVYFGFAGGVIVSLLIVYGVNEMQ